MPRITTVSIPVDDQSRAEDFYTRRLGFVVRHDLPLGSDRWLTVVSPEDPDGPELLLEPMGHPATREYQAALAADGIPWTFFTVDDLDASHAALVAAGVEFVNPPSQVGPNRVAVVDDTCGNLIQLVQLG